MSLLTLLNPSDLNTYPITVTATLRVQAQSTEIPPLFLPGSIQNLQIGQSLNCNFTASGVAADQVDRVYATTLAFAANQPQVLDLTNLKDPYANATTFARIRRIILKFKDTTDGDTLTLGYSGTTANAWTSWLSNPGTLKIPASSSTNDAFAVCTAPNTTGWVVGSTNRLLQLDPGTAAFSVDIEILGCSR